MGSGSKYDSLASKYSRDVDDTSGLTSRYTSRKPLSSDDDSNYSFSRKSVKSSTIGSSVDGDGYSYSRKSIKSSATGTSDDGDSYSYSRKISSGTIRDSDPYSSYSKKSARSITRSDDDLGDGDTHSYSRRSIKSSLETSGTGDSYTGSKYLKTSILGTGVEPVDKESTNDYSSKRYLESDLGLKYSSRSVSMEEGDHKRSKHLGGEADDYVSKYSTKYSSEKMITEDDEDDKYAKYKRKYSRTDSLSDKKATRGDEEDDKYSRKFLRTTSKEKPKAEEEEEDAYEKYARKYLRKESTTEQNEPSGKLESDASISSKKSKYSQLTSPAEIEDIGKYVPIQILRIICHFRESKS